MSFFAFGISLIANAEEPAVAESSAEELELDALRALGYVTASEEIADTNIQGVAQFDRDANPEIKGTGRLRAGVGIYFFEDDLEPKD